MEKNNAGTARGINLSAALIEAAGLLEDVRSGISLTEALQNVPSALKPAAQSLTFNALRNMPKLLGVLKKFIHREVDPEVEDLLLVASSTLLPLSENKYSPYTLVNETVNAASRSEKTKFAKGMVNAVLRRLIENPDLMQLPIHDFVEDYPKWWIKKIKTAYPQQWKEILVANQMHPPQYLRVNKRQFSRDEYAELLAQKEIHVREIPDSILKLAPEGIYLDKPVSVNILPGFNEGSVSIQDLGAQMAAHILAPKDGERVLDACAAPGGKTCHLLELADVSLQAFDIEPSRTLRIQENLDRLKLSAKVSQGNATTTKGWWDGQHFDAIIADVPCSASGIVRRHPDILYLRRPEDIDNLVKLQRNIATNLWSVLKPGGRLLYVTCSIFPEEGENQALWFLEKNKDAVRLPSLGQLLPCEWHDGFFFALFRKT